MDIDYLIDRLEALIQTGKRVPLSNKVMVDEQECYALIDQMRAVVPEEIKAAKRTLNDRERILDEADDTARQILEQAEQERRMMLEQEGLLAEAERQREIILNEATQEAFELRNNAQNIYDEGVNQTQEMREGANQYAMQVLQELETLLDKHLTVVRNGLTNFIQQSQQYQQQIDEYQRQYRPQYAPSKAEIARQTAQRPGPTPAPGPASPPARSRNNTGPAEKPAERPASSARSAEYNPPAASPAPSRPVAVPPSDNHSPGRSPAAGPTPVRSNQAPASGSRSGSSGPSGPTPLDNNRASGRLNVVQGTPLRPVPKANPRSVEPEEDGEDLPPPADDFDFDEPPARPPGPARQSTPSTSNNRATRPPF